MISSLEAIISRNFSNSPAVILYNDFLKEGVVSMVCVVVLFAVEGRVRIEVCALFRVLDVVLGTSFSVNAWMGSGVAAVPSIVFRVLMVLAYVVLTVRLSALMVLLLLVLLVGVRVAGALIGRF